MVLFSEETPEMRADVQLLDGIIARDENAIAKFAARFLVLLIVPPEDYMPAASARATRD